MRDRRRPRSSAGRGVRLALLLFVSACAGEPATRDAASASVYLGDPEALERGRRLFLGTCTGYCHGAERGGSRGEAPDLWDCDWLHGGSDAEIFRSVSQGVPDTDMVGFGASLPDRDIWKLIAYLRSRSACPAP